MASLDVISTSWRRAADTSRRRRLLIAAQAFMTGAGAALTVLTIWDRCSRLPAYLHVCAGLRFCPLRNRIRGADTQLSHARISARLRAHSVAHLARAVGPAAAGSLSRSSGSRRLRTDVATFLLSGSSSPPASSIRRAWTTPNRFVSALPPAVDMSATSPPCVVSYCAPRSPRTRERLWHCAPCGHPALGKGAGAMGLAASLGLGGQWRARSLLPVCEERLSSTHSL